MKGVIEAKDLPLEEKVHLKKAIDGWRVVYPIKKSDGSIDWFVVLTGGSWAIFIKTLLFVAVLLLVTWSYSHDTGQCRDLIENICDYSINISQKCAVDFTNPLSNIPDWNVPNEVKIYGQDT